MKIPIGMEDGQNHPMAQRVQAVYPNHYIGATLFRGDLSIHIHKAGLLPVCGLLHDDLNFDYPIHITSVDDGSSPDTAASGRFEMVYEFFSIGTKQAIRLKARVSEKDCTIESVTGIWKGANYLEREVYDMMGIRFIHHPDLKRILMPEDYDEGFPLRKNFPVEGRGWRDTFEFLEH